MYKIKWNKVGEWCTQNWWILILIAVISVAAISVWRGSDDLVAKLNSFGELANSLLTPTGIVLGLILGYPLIKRKLVDGYITKQFEIIHDANRDVRKQCLILRDKYVPKMISNELKREELLEALEDMKHLNELAMDANELVYHYSYLIYNTLVKFEEKTRDNGIIIERNYTYRETFHKWLHYHILEIYQYSRSIGIVPQTEIKKQKVLVDRIDKYVTDNTYYEVKDLDKSIYYPQNSALLVVFAINNNRCLGDDDWLLHKCCCEVAPSPCPFARIMYNQCIYVPPIITGETYFNVFNSQLYLVGVKRKVTTNTHSGEKSHHYLCIYANISMMHFVNTIKGLEDIAKYRDTYLDIEIDTNGMTNFDKYGEMVRFCISEEAAMQNYENVAKKLKDKLESEI